jgi:hypothetical protein
VKTVVFTPWGREVTASILFEYMKRDHKAGVVDEWHLWLNTDPEQVRDVAYAFELAEDNDWIKLYQLPKEGRLHPKQMNTGRFYTNTQDLDTIYVRMDDDIVWVEENAVARLVQQRIDNPMPFVVFPIIWNNAICSHYLQMNEQLPRWWGNVGNYCMDPLGWGDAHFAEHIHNHLLMCIEKDLVNELFMHHSVQLPAGQQFSVSSFAQFGSEYAKVNGVLGGEEEAWHTVTQPWAQQRPNLIVPNSIVSHFSFYTQREYLFNETNILERYKELSESL